MLYLSEEKEWLFKFFFIIDNIKYELQHIISGESETRYGNNIQTTTHFLTGCKKASGKVEETEYTKEQEATFLKEFINQNNYWVDFDITEETKIGEGAEQKVYLSPDNKYVLKLNDSIYYSFWLDYLHNLLLHNYFFPDTSYQLMGFKETIVTMYAVVKQPFIQFTEPTNISLVRQFLNANGFEIKKNNDYINKELGIIIEDLHDENVLIKQKVLFFIDTVFYLTPKFYDWFKSEMQLNPHVLYHPLLH